MQLTLPWRHTVKVPCEATTNKEIVILIIHPHVNTGTYLPLLRYKKRTWEFKQLWNKWQCYLYCSKKRKTSNPVVMNWYVLLLVNDYASSLFRFWSSSSTQYLTFTILSSKPTYWYDAIFVSLLTFFFASRLCNYYVKFSCCGWNENTTDSSHFVMR